MDTQTTTRRRQGLFIVPAHVLAAMADRIAELVTKMAGRTPASWHRMGAWEVHASFGARALRDAARHTTATKDATPSRRHGRRSAENRVKVMSENG